MHLSDILRERLTQNGCSGMEQQAQGVQTRCGRRPGAEGSEDLCSPGPSWSPRGEAGLLWGIQMRVGQGWGRGGGQWMLLALRAEARAQLEIRVKLVRVRGLLPRSCLCTLNRTPVKRSPNLPAPTAGLEETKEPGVGG